MSSLLRKPRAVLVLFLFGSSAAVAQWESNPMRGPAAERVEQFKKIRLMEALNLDEETSIRFFARYNKHQEAMQQIRRRQIELLQQIQAFRKSNAADEEYGKVLQEMRSLEEKSSEAKLKYFDELGGVLTKKQLAEYIAFEVRFQQNLREILRDIQKKREEQMMKH